MQRAASDQSKQHEHVGVCHGHVFDGLVKNVVQSLDLVDSLKENFF